MNKIFQVFLQTAGILMFAAWVAVTHEADIQHSCQAHGHAGRAAWLGDFMCSPMKKENDHG